MIEFGDYPHIEKSFIGSFLARINPFVKFLLLIIFSIALFLLFDLLKLYILIFLVLGMHYLGDYPFETAKPRYKTILAFSSVILIVQVIFNTDGSFLFYLIPLKFDLIGPFIPVYSSGLIQGFLLMGRFLGLIALSWVFVNSTNPYDFAHSLTKIKVPYRFAYTLSLALRFSPVFSLETRIIQDAQATRGLNVTSDPRGILNILRYTLIPLISSTLNRIQDITLSMEGRAFGYYQQRTYLKEVPVRKSDVLILILVSLFLLMFIIF